jgi:hypothetical protein
MQPLLARADPIGGVSPVMSTVGALPPATLGIDLNPSIERFASGSPAGLATFQISPNPGGAPLAGNSGFSMTLYEPTCSPGVFGISAAALAVPLNIGAPVHIDPALLLLLQPFPCTVATITFPLPIPSTPSLAGASFYMQTAHFLPGGAIATSDAIRVSIL